MASRARKAESGTLAIGEMCDLQQKNLTGEVMCRWIPIRWRDKVCLLKCCTGNMYVVFDRFVPRES